MRKIFQRIKSVPWYGWVLGAVYFILQYSVYRLANLLSNVTGTTAWAICPKIPFIDDRIPVVPVFVIIYLFSYVFWILGPPIASLTGKRNFINYMIGLTAAYLVGFLIFVLLPSYMDRMAEGLYEHVAGTGIFSRLLRMVYDADGRGMAFNLFPSYHCLISIYCYLGIRRRPEVSKGVRIYSLVMALLICLSTVLTKQHYIIDIAGGLAISIICYIIVEKLDPGKRYVKEASR